MRPIKRKAIILAAACVAAGLCVSFAALAALDFNFFEVGTMEPVTSVYTPTEAFTNITVRAAESDVRLLSSEDGTCKVVCNETDKIIHTVEVENDTLIVRSTDNRQWYERIGFVWNHWSPIEVIIYLPDHDDETLYIRTASGDVEVSADCSFDHAEVDGTSGDICFAAAVEGELLLKSVSGSIQVSGTNPDSLIVQSTSGDVMVDSVDVNGEFSCKTISGTQRISDLACENATVYSTSGDVIASDLIASGSIRMEAISGNLRLVGCDADTLWLKTVSGNVIGTLRTEKAFIANSTSGGIRVPDTAADSTCEVKTVSGDINLDVLEMKEEN